jgi:uncharacterized protein with GYD domain
MSLWTPGGEHEVPDPEELSDEDRARLEDAAEEVAEIRRQLASVPASRVVANHAMGLYELAAIHLSSQPPNLSEARVAIDAMGGIVDALEDRFDEDEGVIRDALAQLRLAFVQLQAAQGEGQGPTVDS